MDGSDRRRHFGSKPAQTGEVHAAGSHREAADALRVSAASLRIPSHAKNACQARVIAGDVRPPWLLERLGLNLLKGYPHVET